MDKQQPLTLVRYIVIPFVGIVYIHSVSVVATRPFCVFKFCENLIVKVSFNNALRSLISDDFSESQLQRYEKTLNFYMETTDFYSVA